MRVFLFCCCFPPALMPLCRCAARAQAPAPSASEEGTAPGAAQRRLPRDPTDPTGVSRSRSRPEEAPSRRQNKQKNRQRHQTEQQPPPTTPNRQTTTRPKGTRSGQGQRPREAGGANATPHTPRRRMVLGLAAEAARPKTTTPKEPCGAAMSLPTTTQRQVAQPRRGPPERPTKPDKHERAAAHGHGSP